jgi:hypothetical protein
MIWYALIIKAQYGVSQSQLLVEESLADTCGEKAAALTITTNERGRYASTRTPPHARTHTHTHMGSGGSEAKRKTHLNGRVGVDTQRGLLSTLTRRSIATATTSADVCAVLPVSCFHVTAHTCAQTHCVRCDARQWSECSSIEAVRTMFSSERASRQAGKRTRASGGETQAGGESSRSNRNNCKHKASR